VFKHLLKRIMSERAGQLQSSSAGLSVVLLVDMSAFAYMRHKGIACPAAGNLCRLLWCEYRMYLIINDIVRLPGCRSRLNRARANARGSAAPAVSHVGISAAVRLQRCAQRKRQDKKTHCALAHAVRLAFAAAGGAPNRWIRSRRAALVDYLTNSFLYRADEFGTVIL
jgi:hypothetical protein